MRHGVQRRRALQPQNQIVRELASRATRSVGHTDKIRVDFFQLSDGLVKRFLRLSSLRREELKGNSRLTRLKNIADVHDG